MAETFVQNESIETVIQRYKATVYSVALSYVNNREDADDIFQEVFLIYFRTKPEFNDEEHRKAWLIRTTMNCSKRVVDSTYRKRTVPLDEMEKSNFFYFYYCYLKALHEGCGRSEAFFKAQQSYGHALIADSVNGLRGEGNYQFGLYNLLAYHNFGVLEPNVIAVTEYECKGNICIQ